MMRVPWRTSLSSRGARWLRSGVTLVEVLVVLAIVGLLVALIVPAVMRARASAAQAQCSHQLKQVAMACHQLHDVHQRFPPAFGFFPKADLYSGSTGLGTVFFHLLPHVEQDGLYRKGRYLEPAILPKGGKQQDYFRYDRNDVNRTAAPLFNCPADPTMPGRVNKVTECATSSYAANYLVFGKTDKDFKNLSPGGQPRLAVSFPDGTSQTLLFGEKYAVASIGAADHPVGAAYEGGCHWGYLQATCHNPFLGYYAPGGTDPRSVGPIDAADPRDGRFQVAPAPERCNPCLAAAGHPGGMNAAMADGSVRHLTAGIDRFVWWSLLTPGGAH